MAISSECTATEDPGSGLPYITSGMVILGSGAVAGKGNTSPTSILFPDSIEAYSIDL